VPLACGLKPNLKWVGCDHVPYVPLLLMLPSAFVITAKKSVRSKKIRCQKGVVLLIIWHTTSASEPVRQIISKEVCHIK
jgi:hypothetical protein